MYTSHYKKQNYLSNQHFMNAHSHNAVTEDQHELLTKFTLKYIKEIHFRCVIVVLKFICLNGIVVTAFISKRYPGFALGCSASLKSVL